MWEGMSEKVWEGKILWKILRQNLAENLAENG